MLVALAGHSLEDTCQGTPNSFIFLERGLCAAKFLACVSEPHHQYHPQLGSWGHDFKMLSCPLLRQVVWEDMLMCV